MKELGKRLWELRIKNEMSQDDVARALGVSAQAISRWENGRSDPETSNIFSQTEWGAVSIYKEVKTM